MNMDLDFWKEIWLTVKQQKLRSLMTAFGVFWGIFMITVLTGTGVGFVNAINTLFIGVPSNSIIIGPQTTTMPYGGYEGGRRLKLTENNMAEIERHFAEKIKGSSMLNIAERTDGLPHQVAWGNNAANYAVGGVTPTYIDMMPHRVVSGRYINDIDMDESRKVCVIGIRIQQALFGDNNPIGQLLEVDDKTYTVVGVTKSTNEQVALGVNTSESVLLPRTTEQLAYGQPGKIDVATFVFGDEYPSSAIEPELVALVQQQLAVDPNDEEAIMSINMYQLINDVNTVELGIYIMIWIVGLGTLLAGLIGVSNIMLVTVNERTQEIGVRRALGALPSDITRQILSESLLLTVSSGIVGLMAGTGVLYAMNRSVEGLDSGETMLVNPYIPFTAAIASLLLLIAGGIFAGWVPARRALRIKAIDALREE